MGLDGAQWVAIAIAFLTFGGGVATARITAKPQEKAAETHTAVSLLAAQDAFSDRLQDEMEKLTRRHEERIKDIEADHARRVRAMDEEHQSDRRAWQRERDELPQRIVNLEDRIKRLEVDQDILVEELGVQDAWQKGGASPPAPSIGTKALALLRKHRVQRQDINGD